MYDDMKSIKALFYRGEYEVVLDATYASTLAKNLEHFSYVVGSLSFLGRIIEAESYFLSHEKQLSDLQKSYTYFFLALGHTRRSQYAKAKQFLKQNQALSRKLLTPNFEIQFLAQQGIAFFLFFIGKFDTSAAWGQKSMASAFRQKDKWMMALSYDLFANNLVQTGRIHEGLKYFKEALKLASMIKNHSLVQAIDASLLIFKCEYGVEIQNSFYHIELKFNHSKDVDSFSKANLGLEYVRQLTLRGQWTRAGQILESFSSTIYQSKNRRQEARFNLRWAELCFLKGQAAMALHYVRSGKRCLEFIDQTFEIQFLGLEIKIYEELKFNHTQETLQVIKSRLTVLSEKYYVTKNKHILERQSKKITHTELDSDDEIHNLLLRLQNDLPRASQIVLETGFFTWLYRFLPIRFGQSYILLNLENKSITCVSAEGIDHKPNELSNLNQKILLKLAGGFTTKEDLVHTVWGYVYDPLRHDSMIYSALSNLRKILGVKNNFIETSELGYKLTAQLLNLVTNTSTTKTDKDVTIPVHQNSIISQLAMNDFIKLGLNSRQIQMMIFLETHPFISVKNAVQMFATSEITANRDLRYLHQKNLVLRIGQGRATQYSKKG